MEQQYLSHSAGETEQIAADFAAGLKSGDVIAYKGPMGAGKTAFTRGLCRGLGLDESQVSSPTFALVQEYTHGNIPLYHFDMYRISGFDSLYSPGFFDYLEGDGVLFIEWSENIQGALPAGVILLTIQALGEDTRKITIEGDRF